MKNTISRMQTSVLIVITAMKISFIRKMYWADWGNHPKIETAAMDGTMRETLVEENIQWPTGKANTHKHFSLIIFSNLNTKCESLILKNTILCFIGLAVDYFNQRLYWADAKLSLIGSVRLNGSDAVVAVNSIKNS